MPYDEATVATENPRDEGAYAGPRGEMPTTASVLNAPFGEMGTRNVRAALRLQTEMFEVLHDIGNGWLECATSGAELAFKLPNRLTSAQTVPDALSAYQKWLGEWLTLVSEDGQHLISDGQKIVDKGVSCFAVASPSIAT